MGSFQLIYKHWMNTLVDYCGPFRSHTGYCERLKAFITANLQWVQEQITKQQNSPYWHQVYGLPWSFCLAQSPLYISVKGPKMSFIFL